MDFDYELIIGESGMLVRPGELFQTFAINQRRNRLLIESNLKFIKFSTQIKTANNIPYRPGFLVPFNILVCRECGT